MGTRSLRDTIRAHFTSLPGPRGHPTSNMGHRNGTIVHTRLSMRRTREDFGRTKDRTDEGQHAHEG